ncbi:U3 small nucleolar RNA-associated protein 14 homolog A [Pholidichthys leucotaenia]
MAKVSRKKASKKKLKKAEESVEEQAMCVGEEEEEEADEEVSAEEEEDGDDERRRQKLLEAISALGGKKRRTTLAERSEAAAQVSEFTVTPGGQKLELSELVGTIRNTPGVSGKTKRRLKELERGRRTVECPLSRQQSERIRRGLAFSKASREVSRWKGVIRQNQKAEQLVFPLNREPSGPRPMERVVMGWKARTPLEQEVFAVLSANKQPVNDPVLTPAEEASVAAMSLEEARIRRGELQKARALQSYYEAKARRQRRIKSKKFHKVQNKAKSKELVKKFEELVEKDPACALEELGKMEVARMQERMSLKHQNKSRWAKSRAIMARYDEGARRAMQEQLDRNRDLTQNLVRPPSSEEEEEKEELLPDFVNDVEHGADPSNPWMRGKLSEEPAEEQQGDDDDEEEEEATSGGARMEEEALLREFDSRRNQRGLEENTEVASVEEEEEKEVSEFQSLIGEVTGDPGEAEEVPADSSAPLLEGLMRIRTLEDAELLPQEEQVVAVADEAPAEPPAASQNQKKGSGKKRKRGIELKQVLTKETHTVAVPLAPTFEDCEESEESLDQRGLIKEAFAGDNVVADFLKEKRKKEDEGKPKVLDLTLPGWGEWGGGGLKPSRVKRLRFRVKVAPPPPRKDRQLPAVIISEKRNSAVALHQVGTLPFPFKSAAPFESTIRSPLGRTWNTERTVKKLTKPRVVTIPGTIIEPITREELEKDKKQASMGRRSGVEPGRRK